MPTKPDGSGLPEKTLHINDWIRTVIEVREGVPLDQIRDRLKRRGYYPERIEKWLSEAREENEFTSWTRESWKAWLAKIELNYGTRPKDS